MSPSCQCNPFSFHMVKGFLHVSKQASSTSEGKRHGPDLSKDMIPFFDADPPLVRGGGGRKNIFEAYSLGGEQSQSHVDCVHRPNKEHITGRPLTVACIKILEGDGFLSLVGVKLVQRSEHLV